MIRNDPWNDSIIVGIFKARHTCVNCNAGLSVSMSYDKISVEKIKSVVYVKRMRSYVCILWES